MGKPIQVSVDAVMFTVIDDSLRVLLVKRNIEPFLDFWSLPGGLIEPGIDADLKAAALRKLKEKTNVDAPYLEQVLSTGDASRDPRGWSLSVVYSALLPEPKGLLAATYGASELRWEAIRGESVALHLAFDHDLLLSAAVERLRAKVGYTSIAAYLLDEPFTIGELHRINETILQRKVEKKSLVRRYIGEGVLMETDEYRQAGRMRPARLYRLSDRETPHYFTRSMEGPWDSLEPGGKSHG